MFRVHSFILEHQYPWQDLTGNTCSRNGQRAARPNGGNWPDASSRHHRHEVVSSVDRAPRKRSVRCSCCHCSRLKAVSLMDPMLNGSSNYGPSLPYVGMPQRLVELYEWSAWPTDQMGFWQFVQSAISGSRREIVVSDEASFEAGYDGGPLA
jgi:hypothetical protein